MKENGPIEADTPVDELRQTPYALPATFEWTELDLTRDEELQELYTLLAENYVEACQS